MLEWKPEEREYDKGQRSARRRKISLMIIRPTFRTLDESDLPQDFS